MLKPVHRLWSLNYTGLDLGQRECGSERGTSGGGRRKKGSEFGASVGTNLVREGRVRCRVGQNSCDDDRDESFVWVLGRRRTVKVQNRGDKGSKGAVRVVQRVRGGTGESDRISSLVSPGQFVSSLPTKGHESERFGRGKWHSFSPLDRDRASRGRRDGTGAKGEIGVRKREVSGVQQDGSATRDL